MSPYGTVPPAEADRGARDSGPEEEAMARPRYSAAKRAREIKKQEERARKLARKHGRSAGRTSTETPGAPENPAPAPEDTPQQ